MPLAWSFGTGSLGLGNKLQSQCTANCSSQLTCSTCLQHLGYNGFWWLIKDACKFMPMCCNPVNVLLRVFVKVALCMTLVTCFTFHFNANNFSCLDTNHRNHAIQRLETSPGSGSITRDSNTRDFVSLLAIFVSQTSFTAFYISASATCCDTWVIDFTWVAKDFFCYRPWHVHNSAKCGLTGSASSDDLHSQCQPRVNVKKPVFSMNNFLWSEKLLCSISCYRFLIFSCRS